MKFGIVGGDELMGHQYTGRCYSGTKNKYDYEG